MPSRGNKLSVAIAGCHRMLDTVGKAHNWANGFARVPETTVVAVFDKGEEARQQFQSVWRDTWGEVPGYDDYDKMLADSKPDIVCVATRQTMHADQIEAAIGEGVQGIACEKPFATSLEESDRIVSACKGANVPLAYLLDRRWNENYRAVRRTLDKGAIGDVTGVLASGVPNVINHGCHWYDTALALAGDREPVWVSGHVDDLPDEPPDSRRPLDPPARSWIQLAGGAHISTLPEGPTGTEFRVYGTEGWLITLSDAQEAYYWRNEDSTKRVPLDLSDDAEEWPSGRAAIEDLVDAVNRGKTTACDLDEARRATEIGFATHMSHRASGARIPLPVADRTLRIESFLWGNE